MEKKLTKADLVAKIAKEQNLEPKKLSRLSMDQLYQMDKVVPDEGADILGGEATQEEATVGESTQEVGGESEDSSGPTEDVDSKPESSEKVEEVLLGYHPVTGKPVYK